MPAPKIIFYFPEFPLSSMNFKCFLSQPVLEFQWELSYIKHCMSIHSIQDYTGSPD